MKNNRKPFTPGQQEFLLKNRLKMPSGQLSEHLGCSKCKVQNFFKKKGLKLPAEVREKFRREGLKGRTSFTPEMDQFLKENYLTMPVKPLGEKIGKSYTGIMIRLRQLGLEIPKALREKRKAIGQIKPGQEPSNKGKKWEEYMTPEHIEKLKKTQFKKGSIPKNTKHDGYERITKDGYIQVRVKQGKFELKHRVVWEKENGKIPKGYCIWFKDQNRLNCQLDNLELITRRENARRNKEGFDNLPEELKQTIKLKNKILKSL